MRQREENLGSKRGPTTSSCTTTTLFCETKSTKQQALVPKTVGKRAGERGRRHTCCEALPLARARKPHRILKRSPGPSRPTTTVTPRVWARRRLTAIVAQHSCKARLVCFIFLPFDQQFFFLSASSNACALPTQVCGSGGGTGDDLLADMGCCVNACRWCVGCSGGLMPRSVCVYVCVATSVLPAGKMEKKKATVGEGRERRWGIARAAGLRRLWQRGRPSRAQR